MLWYHNLLSKTRFKFFECIRPWWISNVFDNAVVFTRKYIASRERGVQILGTFRDLKPCSVLCAFKKHRHILLLHCGRSLKCLICTIVTVVASKCSIVITAPSGLRVPKSYETWVTREHKNGIAFRSASWERGALRSFYVPYREMGRLLLLKRPRHQHTAAVVTSFVFLCVYWSRFLSLLLALVVQCCYCLSDFLAPACVQERCDWVITLECDCGIIS